MSKYPLIESMGLKVHYDYETGSDTYFVKADDLEKALQNALVVHGVVDSPEWYTFKKDADVQPKNMDGKDVYKARLVCIQPIKKKTKAERIADLVEGWSRSGDIINYKYLKEAIDKILELPE